MNETEINEDNCVLDNDALKILGDVLKRAVERSNDKMLAKVYLNSIFERIKKLNEMAKKELGK